MQGFNLALDLTNVQKKGETPSNNNQKLNIYQQNHPEIIDKSSVGRNSDAAHIIQDPGKLKSERSSSVDSSSSGDFIPPPELNPNLVFGNKQKSSTPAPIIKPGLGFKLNLSGVPDAHLITKDDKSRVKKLQGAEAETYNNTVNIKINSDNSSDKGEREELANTSKTPIIPPKLPGIGGIGGLGGGFKLNLGNVPTAHIITEEDKKKQNELGDIRKISKNNFTDTTQIKGEKPKKLNVKHKDSTTKVSLNETSVQNLKKVKDIKVKKGTKNKKFKKKIEKVDKKKKSRNMNTSKISSLVIDNSDASSIFESATESDQNRESRRSKGDSLHKSKKDIRHKEIEYIKQEEHNKSSSNISKVSDLSKSDISNGSYVGSNKVFVPFLNIQEDVIQKEQEEKKKHEEEIRLQRNKDKSNPRYQMKRVSGDKNIKNLLKTKNKKVFSDIKTSSKGSLPGLNMDSSSSDMIPPSTEEKDPKPNPFALNLSSVQKKGEPAINKVKDNSFFEKSEEKEHWDIKVVNENKIYEYKKELTVTLGQDSKVNVNIPLNKISKSKGGGENYLSPQHIRQGLNSPYHLKSSSRGIYYDDELHTMFIYLIFSLILTPQKGTLDDLYC